MAGSGSQQSKTARASMPKVAAQKGSPYVAALTSEINRIIPLGEGRFAYVLDPATSRTVHLSTSSEEFVAKISELASNGLASRLIAELDLLVETYPGHGWADTKARLEAAGAFAEAA